MSPAGWRGGGCPPCVPPTCRPRARPPPTRAGCPAVPAPPPSSRGPAPVPCGRSWPLLHEPLSPAPVGPSGCGIFVAGILYSENFPSHWGSWHFLRANSGPRALRIGGRARAPGVRAAPAQGVCCGTRTGTAALRQAGALGCHGEGAAALPRWPGGAWGAAWGAAWGPSRTSAPPRRGRHSGLRGPLWEVPVRVPAWSQDRSSSEPRAPSLAWSHVPALVAGAGAGPVQLCTRGRQCLLCGRRGGVRKSCLGLALPTQGPRGCRSALWEPQPYLRAVSRPPRVGCPGLLDLGWSGGNPSALPVGEGRVTNQQLEK